MNDAVKYFSDSLSKCTNIHVHVNTVNMERVFDIITEKNKEKRLQQCRQYRLEKEKNRSLIRMLLERYTE